MFGANHNTSNSCINTFIIIIIYVYSLLLATPTTVLVEVGALIKVDAAVNAELAADEVHVKDMDGGCVGGGRNRRE